MDSAIYANCIYCGKICLKFNIYGDHNYDIRCSEHSGMYIDMIFRDKLYASQFNWDDIRVHINHDCNKIYVYNHNLGSKDILPYIVNLTPENVKLKIKLYLTFL